MKPLLLLILLFVCVLPVSAQDTGVPAVPPPYRATGGITVGYFNTEFFYPDAEKGVTYAFNQPMLTVMFAGDGASLSLSYGSYLPSETSIDHTTKMMEAVAHLGGNSFLFEHFLNQPVAIYIPIRLNLGYRYFSYSEAEGEGISTTNGEPAPDLHLATAGLGAGLGTQVRIPTPVPLLQDNLVAAASWVMTYGVTGDAATEFAQIGLSRALDFNAEVKLEKLLGSNLGATLGYTRRTLRWRPQSPASFQDVLDTYIAGQETFAQYHTQHMIRIGINW